MTMTTTTIEVDVTVFIDGEQDDSLQFEFELTADEAEEDAMGNQLDRDTRQRLCEEAFELVAARFEEVDVPLSDQWYASFTGFGEDALDLRVYSA